MSGYGVATAGSKRKIICKQLKDLRRTGTSLTVTTKDRITAVQDTLSPQPHMKEEKGEIERKKEAGMQEKRMNERRTCKSTRLTNLNGFFEVHES